ncbi:MAG: class I SAM-dependent DNA methyltransferase [Gemmatimonadetes bacterium]|nr:class I SAM-dependent DNA methyltransferase [Gemmatimonadota bacterium]MYI63504.1 class I SAM-dependent DNA methyltransferase [Gemmatimonadota bacterium]
MRLSWNEIRSRAAQFAAEWANATYESGETQSFYNEFFEIFGVRRRTVARYEEHVRRLDNSHGFIDLFWPGVLLVEQKSAGRDLTAARKQAGTYFDALPERDRPRYQLLCDFQTFELLDRDEREETRFALADLPQHVEKFGFIIGVQRRTFRDQDPVNIEASERIARLHDALAESGYDGHDLELFLVRMVFCLFADDTGIFEPRDIFLQFVEERTSPDGSDLGPFLARLFQVLNTPEERRQTKLDEDLARFPYVNGELFTEPLRIPDFDAEMRQSLLDACLFDWTAISPAIFGSLFQSVMEPAERRAQGAHYTTEQNIRKVIEPLFLDDLRAEFARLKARRDNRRIPDLYTFQQKLGLLTFLDPACGCGNFLIIAYRELRQLEIEVLRELHPSGQLSAFAELLSVVNVDQFYGIEISEFPARIAETALWMMDHIMNNRLSLEFGQTYARIPLEKSPHIMHGDALETDWSELLPPEACSYVLGNPPFVGAKFQSPEQREQVRRIAALGKSGGTLDYVTAWFIKAGEYVQQSAAPLGFVATNSITQGEQVAQLWPILFDRCKLDIAFAHRTFAWGSDARGTAHVHVVIIGLGKRGDAPREKRLFSYDAPKSDPQESQHAALSPYLFDAGGLTDSRVVVKESAQALNGLPKLIIGSKPIDGSHYIFNADERAVFLREEPGAEPYLRPFVGSREFLQGGERWILHLADAPPQVLKTLPNVRERIAAVRAYRLASKSKPTQALAETPRLYHVNVIPTAPFLVVPEVSSERRDYIPIAWLEPPVIPSNKVRILSNATLWQFGLLTSAMHMAWVRNIGGRLKSDFSYGIGIIYNTFPLPPFPQNRLQRLAPHADAVLAARANHPDATLADLYDPDLMPADLRKAHQALDRAVDRLYRRSAFTSDRERVEHLFGLYEKMRVPLTAEAEGKRKKRRKVKKR